VLISVAFVAARSPAWNAIGHAKADVKPAEEKSVVAAAAPDVQLAPTKADKQKRAKPAESAEVSQVVEAVKAKRAKTLSRSFFTGWVTVAH
jgi:hypothetical protein